MQLTALNQEMKLFCRRPIKMPGRSYEAGEEFPFVDYYRKGILTWRTITLLYEQRRLISEFDPYFDEVMRGPGMRNNPEFAKKWIEAHKPPEPIFEKEKEENDPSDFECKVEIRPCGKGWFEVVVDGEIVSPKRLRRDAAEQLAKEF